MHIATELSEGFCTMESSSNVGSLESHFNGGDWSPRISFSHSFACVQRISSPAKHSLHDSEFEFSLFAGADLPCHESMLSADELFRDGKLRPLERISETACINERIRRSSQRREEVEYTGSRIGEKGTHASCGERSPLRTKEDLISLYRSGADNVGKCGQIECNAGQIKLPSALCTEQPASVSRTEKVEIGKNTGNLRLRVPRSEDLLSVHRTAEKLEKGGKASALRSPESREEFNSARTLEVGEKAGKLRLPASRDVRFSASELEMGGKAEKSRSPRSRQESISAHKPEMGEKEGKLRSPTSREGFIPPCKMEICSKAAKLRSPTSRDDLMSACKLEIGGEAGKLRSPTDREDIMSACRRAEMAEMEGKTGEAKVPSGREGISASCRIAPGKGEKGGVPVRWREELQWTKRSEKDEQASHFRRFCKNPRSASMTVDGSFRHTNRSACVSLNNSRCPSPSRSFSLPATTPTSPTASRSFSAFSSTSSSSSSSSSSKYKSRIKEFFKLRKLGAPSESSSASSTTCRLPLSPRSFFPFFKSKDNTNPSSNSIPTSPQKAHGGVYVATRDLSTNAKKEQYGISSSGKELYSIRKDLNPLSKSQISSTSNKDLRTSCSTPNSNSSIPPPSQLTSPMHFTPSSTCKVAAALISPPTIDKPMQTSADCAIGSRRIKTRREHSLSLPHEKMWDKDGREAMFVIEEGQCWDDGSLSKSNSALDLHTSSPHNALNLHAYSPSNALTSHSKQGMQIQRVEKVDRGNMKMVGSGGGLVRPMKGLERPIPYTSSVRVTPVLNVPACITPSLRKTKSSSMHKAFSFESLFALKREKIHVGFNSTAGHS